MARLFPAIFYKLVAPFLPPDDAAVKKQEAEPGAHPLPDREMWKITMWTAVGMACLNCVTIFTMRTIVKMKFWLVQYMRDEYGEFWATVALVCTVAVLSAACMTVIFKYDPSAGSSGAPENRGWLNGNGDGKFFTFQSLWVRGLATILGNAAGYPVGREGPTVTMGSNLAYLICNKWTETSKKKQFDDAIVGGAGGEVMAPVLEVDEERLAAAKRITCAVAGACGMAMIFDSPIGGILYMFEEVTATCWPFELTFRAFAGTVACAMLSRAFLNLLSTDTKAFVVYEWSPQRHPWDWWDLPTFVLIAGVLGPFSALHTWVCLQVGSARQRVMKALDRFQPAAKICEAVLYACLCATVVSTVSQTGSCEPLRPGDSRELVRFQCPHGFYNPVASLLLTTSEGAVNLLFSRRNADEIHPSNAAVALCAYTFLNVGLTGVPAPSGNFTGTMLIGGLVGRIIGDFSRLYLYGDAASGIYAMAGSAAMLCGFKRMSLAVVWFVSSAASDFNLVPPLMLTVGVSLTMAQLCKERGFDEEQVVRRNVPFLEPEPPAEFDEKTAIELCLDPAPASLQPEMAAKDVERVLKEHPGVTSFPVVRRNAADKEICIGFTTRERLENAIEACKRRKYPSVPTELSTEEGGEFERLVSEPPLACRLKLDKLVDCAPYTVLKDMPAPRLYALFAKAGVNITCVVNEKGEFVGMVNRAGLIELTRSLDH